MHTAPSVAGTRRTSLEATDTMIARCGTRMSSTAPATKPEIAAHAPRTQEDDVGILRERIMTALPVKEMALNVRALANRLIA